MSITVRNAFAVAVSIAVSSHVLTAGSPAYDAASTAAWREKREAELKSAEGWLTVAGLYFLKPGANSIGTDSASDVILPQRAGLPSAGAIDFTPPGKVVLQLAQGVPAQLDGRAAAGRVEFLPADRAAKRPASRVSVGGVSLEVHRSGDRVAIRLRDPRSELRTQFTQLRWYPVDAAWAVEGRFLPFAAPRHIPTQNILGDNTVSVSPGEVELKLNGTVVRLLAFEAEGGKLSFVLSDATAGTDTYRLRFLSADKPDADGKVIVDFNRAYNPPCAFNPYTTCPLPVAQNRLKVPVHAGEKLYVGAAKSTVH